MKDESTRQLEAWKSEFGDQYTDRNTFDPDSRVPAFREMLKGLQVKKVLEVGSNIGNNLVSISKTGEYQLIGIEPNLFAVRKGRTRSNLISIIEGNGFAMPFVDGYFDLAFTCGVLIHIANEDLPRVMNEMYRLSNRYILVIEYFAEKDTEIEYRGKKGLLFKRDFKKKFLELKPDLKCIREGFWGKNDGFDDCTWWLFEKPAHGAKK